MIRIYEWDAANRLIAINYTGASNRTEFVYDGLSRRVKILEKTGSTVNTIKKFVWDGVNVVEQRDNDNAVKLRYYAQGVLVADTNTSYYYLRDHLGTIREMTNGAGAIEARYEYDLWGNRTKIAGNQDADFGFTGHFYHASSNLLLAPFRAYDATSGRWINRDPMGESSGVNLYEYVGNNMVG